jgi:hypothetical protein
MVWFSTYGAYQAGKGEQIERKREQGRYGDSGQHKLTVLSPALTQRVVYGIPDTA